MDAAALSAEQQRAARKRRYRLAWYVLGLILTCLALWQVWRQQEMFTKAWDGLRTASPLMLAAVALLPLLNWLMTGWVYWLLTRRYGRVGRGEMLGLVGAAWLFNLLPMRPGLLGRVAYHKAVNGIAVRDSAKVLVQVIGCTATVALLLALVCFCISAMWGLGVLSEPVLVGFSGFLVLFPAGVLLAAGLGASRAERVDGRETGERTAAIRALALAAAIRYLEMIVWAARYWLVFEVIGAPVSFWQLGVIVVSSQVAGLLPVQLGVREWIVGVMTGVVATLGVAAVGGPSMTQGLLADLINRAAEVACSVPLGLTAAAWLARRRQAAGLGAVNPEAVGGTVQ